MKKLVVIVLLLALCGCKDKALEPYFTAEEAEKYLTVEDKNTVGRCVEYIKKYEEEMKSGDKEREEKAGELFSLGFDPIKELYGKSLDDNSPEGVRRSAALAWVMVDFSYRNFNGTCASRILMAANLGLIDAIKAVRNPPDEDLASYLLPPEEQKRRKEKKLPPYGNNKEILGKDPEKS